MKGIIGWEGNGCDESLKGSMRRESDVMGGSYVMRGCYVRMCECICVLLLPPARLQAMP